MREYAARQGWTVAIQVRKVGSGAVQPASSRETAGSRPPPLDRCGARLVAGPMGPLRNGSAGNIQQLEHLGAGFVSLTEALDLTTPAGRAMAGLLAVFATTNARFCRRGPRLVWRMLDRTGNGWVDRRPLPYALPRSGNYIARRQQIGDRPPNLGPPPPDPKEILIQEALRSLAGRTTKTPL